MAGAGFGEGRGKREEGRGKPPGSLLLHDAGTGVARSSGGDRLATRQRFVRRGDPIG